MRPITMMQAQWKAESKEGESLRFERCKGGYFSDIDEYGLKVVGKTYQDGTPSPDNPIEIQCVKAGTKVKCMGKNLVNIPDIEAGANGYGMAIQWFWSNREAINGLPKDKTYTFKYKLETDGEKYNEHIGVSLYMSYTDGTGKMFNPCVNVDIFNGGKTVSGMTVYGSNLAHGASYNNFSEFILCFGDAEDYSYEPYISGGEITTPCDLYEGDIWYPVSGKVEKHNRKLEFNGTENFVDFLDYANSIVNVIIPYYCVTNPGTTFKCTHFYDVAYSDSPGSGLKFRKMSDMGIISVDEFRNIVTDAYNEGSPVTVIYLLKTPIIEQYPPQPIFMPKGTVNVLQQRMQLTADLSATVLVRR